ncbi:hypothetical protein CR513_46375, partial [Mucuna pruriens]
MEEIRTRAEKHIEAEEDQVDLLEAEQKSGPCEPRPTIPGGPKGEAKHLVPPRSKGLPLSFTPLREKRAQIPREICHTRLLKFPKEVKGRVLGSNRQDWYEFRRAYNHSTEERAGTTLPPIITFSENDMRYEPPRQDKPMLISVIIVEYKVERVLID